MRRLFFPLLMGLVGCAVLLSLGIWQLQRMSWKAEILDRIDARVDGARATLPADPDPETDGYLPVEITGSFTGDALYVLISNDGPGFRVIEAFDRPGAPLIMVDRGFIPAVSKQSELALGPMTVTGILHWPQEVDSWTPDPNLEENEWYARDVGPMAEALGTDPILVIATSVTDPTLTPLPPDTSTIPNDHREYAITWFALAAVWAIMTGLWATRIRKSAT